MRAANATLNGCVRATLKATRAVCHLITMKSLILLLAALMLFVPLGQAAERVCTPGDVACVRAIHDGVPGCPAKGTHHTVGVEVDIWAALAGADANAGHHCSFGIVFFTRDHANAEARMDGVGYAGASYERTGFGGSSRCTISYWAEVLDAFTAGTTRDCPI